MITKYTTTAKTTRNKRNNIAANVATRGIKNGCWPESVGAGSRTRFTPESELLLSLDDVLMDVGWVEGEFVGVPVLMTHSFSFGVIV